MEKINEFLNYIKTFKSEGTYKFYKIKLTKFYNYFMENKKKINQQNINEFIQELKKTNKNNTINKYIIIIKKYLNFLNSDNSISFTYLKKDSARFPNLNKKEYKKLVEFLPCLNIKEKIIIHLFLETGVRIRELINIKIQDLNIEEKYINLKITKNNKNRYVFITSSTNKLLKDFIKKRDKKELLLNASYSQIYRLFKKIKDNTKITKLSPHILRHTFATNLLLNNINLYTLKNLLGHENLKTTEIYLHSNKEFDYREFKKASKTLFKA